MTITGPLNHGLWVDRLTEKVAALRRVGRLIDMPRASDTIRVSPQAFVVPVSDAASSRPGPGNTVISQRVNAIVGIVIVLASNRAPIEGSAAAADLETIRTSIFDALIGWQPAGTDVAVQFLRGDLFLYRDSVLWWTDRFSTAYLLRKEYTT